MENPGRGGPRRRSKSVIVIWLVFGVLVAATAVRSYLNRDNEAIVEDDDGGRCGVMGFGFLLVLIVGTYMEGRSARRKK